MSDKPLEYWRYGLEAKELLLKKNAENERLQGELQSVHAHLQHYRDLVDHLRAEIERLRSELEDEEKSVFACMKMCKERDAEIERLQAHNNRLISHGHDLSEMITERDAQLTEAAAFLDGLAERFDATLGWTDAADCRAMAKRLRGET